MRRALPALLLLAALLRAQVAPAPEPPPEPLPGEPRCGWCGTTGRTPVDLDAKFRVEQDAGETWKTEWCSVAQESDDLGLPWAP